MQRYEVEIQEMGATLEIYHIPHSKVRKVDDLTETPEDEEIQEAMKKEKDSTPGKNGTRMAYKNVTCPQIKAEIKKMVKFIFQN